MKKNFFKSVWAAVVGIAIGIILSIATDILLESTGAMIRQPFDDNPHGSLLLLLFTELFTPSLEVTSLQSWRRIIQ